MYFQLVKSDNIIQRSINDVLKMWPTKYMIIFLDARTDFPWCEMVAGYVIMCGLAYFLFYTLPRFVGRIVDVYQNNFY